MVPPTRVALDVHPAQHGLALGCSRFGSVVNGVDEALARRLVDAALANGVAHFDTADIYGQGDSERILGRVLREKRRQVFIATKIGQRFPLWNRLLRPFKAPISALISRGAGKSGLQTMRARPLPRCYRPDYVRQAVHASLRRLGDDHVDLIYLHSPSTTDLADGEAVGALERLREQGVVARIGVSADDLETARRALDDHRVSALQIPYSPMSDGWSDVLERAALSRVSVAVRSLFSGTDRRLDETARRGLVSAAANDPSISTIIIGTSNDRHLHQVASWVRTVPA